MMMHHQKTMAFHKVFYDQVKLPEGLTNKVGQAVPVIGSPTDAIMTSFKPSDMSQQAMQIVAARELLLYRVQFFTTE